MAFDNMEYFSTLFSDKPEIETRSVKFTVESEHNLDMYTVSAKWSDIPVSFLMRKINFVYLSVWITYIQSSVL